MTLQLKQVRRCDGKCCEESPRFPNVDHSDCIYHDTRGGKENRGCMLMRGDAELPSSGCIEYRDLSIAEIFKNTCVNWPQNIPTLTIGETGNCCIQVVGNGN